jgi:hypothetical protein
MPVPVYFDLHNKHVALGAFVVILGPPSSIIIPFSCKSHYKANNGGRSGDKNSAASNFEQLSAVPGITN